MNNIISKKVTDMSAKEFTIFNVTVVGMIIVCIFVGHSLIKYFFTRSFDIDANIVYAMVRGTLFGALAVICNIVGRAIGRSREAEAAEAE